MSSFTRKQLRVTLILAGTNAVFPGTNSNTLVLENLRMTVKTQGVARISTNADVRIYGMRQADMNAVSIAWANPPIILNHLVIVESNSTGRADGWTQVFKGTIIEAQPDYRSMPDVSFNILARTGYGFQVDAAEPISYPEAVDVSTVVNDIVALMGDPWTLRIGEGVTAVFATAYYNGTLWDQLSRACEDAKCDFYIQGDEILVTGIGLPGSATPAVVLNAGSGLVGYPSFERAGLSVNALYDPAFLCGTALEIESVVPNATGRWFPYSLQHDLEALTPRGAWFSQMMCSRVLV